ncbi:MAG: ATP-binding protein [Phycisphaerae bacterium]
MSNTQFNSIESYPLWAQSLADRYLSGTTSVFILHGNVHDMVCVGHEATSSFLSLQEFLATEMFGDWEVVVQYDLGRGARPKAGNDSKRLQEMVQYLTSRFGDIARWPREPDQMLLRFEALFERNLLEERAEDRKRIAILLDYAEHLVPAGPIGNLGLAVGANLVRLLGWAQNPYLKKTNAAICLIADRLSDVNDRLVHSPHVATVEIPLPDLDSRQRFIAHGSSGTPEKIGEFAKISNGLSLVNVDHILSQSRRNGGALDSAGFAQAKKLLIERQCQGLLEFITPRHTLDLVVGHDAAKSRLRDDAAMLARGRLDAAPMGYLISGAVGTGKTFLAECYAGSIGIPCVKLRNFRSKYVGETEGNLERVLAVLRLLGPVVVMIDEADAALGDRSSEGDSGTSNRVFSMIASQMGDTRYRGRIVWMLLTCRPDLLPIDLKRQGRAEVHIPLFYPTDEGEIRNMIEIMARKNGIQFEDALSAASIPARELSGADIESVLMLARRSALADGRETVRAADIHAALTDFIPSVQGLEKELQELAAVLECTQMTFLNEAWRVRVEEKNGRAALQERLVALRQIIES